MKPDDEPKCPTCGTKSNGMCDVCTRAADQMTKDAKADGRLPKDWSR